jgi:hypothetical protein
VYAATQVFGFNAVLLGQRGAFSDGKHLLWQLVQGGLPCVDVKPLGPLHAACMLAGSDQC